MGKTSQVVFFPSFNFTSECLRVPGKNSQEQQIVINTLFNLLDRFKTPFPFGFCKPEHNRILI